LSVKKIIPQILEYVKPAGYSSLTIILFVGYGGIGSCPIFSVGIYRSLPFGGSWRTAVHAYALTITKRKCLTNEHSVVKELSRFRYTKENGAKAFLPYTP